MPKLDNKNYEVWKILIQALLTRKSVEEVLDAASVPTYGPNSSVTKAWMKKDALARAELILHVEPDQLAHMTGSHAHEIWTELERVHRARGFATRLALRRRFLTLKKRSDQPMSQWISEVRSLAFRLRGIGVSVEDEDVILVLTMGLPVSFDHFVIALDATDPSMLTLEDVISRLLNEESRQEYVAPEATENPTALSAHYPTRSKPSPSNLAHITCFTCGNKGHYQANCPSHSSSSPAPSPAPSKPAAAAAPSSSSKSKSRKYPDEAQMGIVLDIDEGW